MGGEGGGVEADENPLIWSKRTISRVYRFDSSDVPQNVTI